MLEEEKEERKFLFLTSLDTKDNFIFLKDILKPLIFQRLFYFQLFRNIFGLYSSKVKFKELGK